MNLIDSILGGFSLGLKHKSPITINKMDTNNGMNLPCFLLCAGISVGIYRIIRLRDEARDRRDEARDRRDEARDRRDEVRDRRDEIRDRQILAILESILAKKEVSAALNPDVASHEPPQSLSHDLPSFQ